MSEMPGVDQDSQPHRPGRFVKALAVAAAVVTLAGCSSADKKSAQPKPTTAPSVLGHEPSATSVPTTDSGPKEACGAHSYEFGRYFSADNATEIYKQLGLLRLLQAPDPALTVADAGTGYEVIAEMDLDPAYAEGMASALDKVRAGMPVTLGEFLETPTGRLDVCETDHLGRTGTLKWQQDVTEVGDFLEGAAVGELFHKAGEQVGVAGARMQERISGVVNNVAA